MAGTVELTEVVRATVGCSKRKAEKAVKALVAEIADRCSGGELVVIRGFGSFRNRRYQKRIGTNPKTHQPMEVPAREMLTFRASRQAVKPL